MKSKHVLKRWWVWAIIILLIVVVGGAVFSGGSKSEPEVAIVERRDVVQEVLVTGRVEPTQEADLAFEKSGVISNIYVRVGESVLGNDALVSLDRTELLAEYAQAQAQVSVQAAKLVELEQGTRPEEIEVQRVKVKSAEIALVNSELSLRDELSDAFTDVDDAVRRTVDQFIDNPKSSNPQLSFTVAQDTAREIAVEQGRLSIEKTINDWILATSEALPDRIVRVRNALLETRTLLENSANLLSVLAPSSSITSTTIDGWKSNVSTARTSINTALSGLTNAVENYEDAERALVLAKEELALKEAGTVPAQITAQRAALDEAQARLDAVNAQLAKMTLRAPFGGIVTKIEKDLGELANAQEVITGVIGDGVFEITANVPEADIAKVHINAPAHVTLDAYGDDEVFDAYVTAIDPAETIIDGVATYKVTLLFKEKDDRIRSGMTADTTIITGEVDGVLAIPSRLVRTEGRMRVVTILTQNGNTEDREVVTGLKGADGYIEIIEGLREGDNVVRER